MSILGEKLELLSTGTSKLDPRPSPFIYAKEHVESIVYPNEMTGYALTVTFSVKGFVHSESGQAIQEFKERCKRQIIEEVFGQFRKHFITVDRALLDRDCESARKALVDFEVEMFT